jgi:hypothetical protein
MGKLWGKFMRGVVTSLLLAVSAAAALAQTGSITPAPSAPAPGATAPAKSPAAAPAKPIKTKGVVGDAKAECLKMWDAGTHMSRQEWSRTCDRIQTRLDNLKVENLDVMGTGVRNKGAGKQGRADVPGRPN